MTVKHATLPDAPEPVSAFALEELERRMVEMGEPAYRGRQLFEAVYRRGMDRWDRGSNLSRPLIGRLKGRLDLSLPEILRVDESGNGSKKHLLRLRDGATVETALLRERGRWTLCLSTQVGCGFGCAFCLTAKGGVKRNLRAHEIVDQVRTVRPDGESEGKVSNLVFMGMGEPLANLDAVEKAVRILMEERGAAFGARKITVSTVGLPDKIRRLSAALPVNLAISLNAPNDALRGRIMPVNDRHPIAEVLKAVRERNAVDHRRVTFEYVLLKGFNDAPSHAAELARRLSGLRCKANLIPFNPFPGAEFDAPDPEAVERFRVRLLEKGVDCYVRRSKGRDIMAACGQLSFKEAAGFSEAALK